MRSLCSFRRLVGLLFVIQLAVLPLTKTLATPQEESATHLPSTMTQVQYIAEYNGESSIRRSAAPTTMVQIQYAPVTREEQAVLDQMTELGLTPQQASAVFQRLNPWTLSSLLKKQPTDLTYMALPHYHPQYLERYRAYAQLNPTLGAGDVVTEVNIGLDLPFYQSVQQTPNPDSLYVLVNKYNALPADYLPALVRLGADYAVGVSHLRVEAHDAFVAMAEAAREDEVVLRSVSAYRSYRTQASLHKRYSNQDGQSIADTYSARAGCSEHQTGLALDINSASQRDQFELTDAYAWLLEHCADYGFILRYPSGKEYITGYHFEPWHYRYVGQEIASTCMQQGLTYEEYLALIPPLAPEDQAAPGIDMGIPHPDTVLAEGLYPR